MYRIGTFVVFAVFLVDSFRSSIIFDLSHPIKSDDPIFPGLDNFNFSSTFRFRKFDEKNSSYFGALNVFTSSEHFGSHIDAPFHMAENGWTLDKIPFERLVSIRGLIVDVSSKSSKTKNYQIQISDLDENFQIENEKFFVLFFYTGKSKNWPDQKRYAGGSTRDELDFPGLSPELAEHLVEKYSKNLVAVGVDTLSLDPGSSEHFPVHRILFRSNIYGLENVANLDRIIEFFDEDRNVFFELDVLPMKIHGATGAPCRIIARLPEKTNGSSWFIFLSAFIFIFVAFCFILQNYFHSRSST